MEIDASETIFALIHRSAFVLALEYVGEMIRLATSRRQQTTDQLRTSRLLDITLVQFVYLILHGEG